MVRFTGAEPVVFASAIGCGSFRAFAHLARCACAILRREAADIIRVGWFALPNVPEPFNDSITEIPWSMLFTRACACLRSARSCWSALLRFPIVPPSVFDNGGYCRLMPDGRLRGIVEAFPLGLYSAPVAGRTRDPMIRFRRLPNANTPAFYS